jgi:hypothetical protein
LTCSAEKTETMSIDWQEMAAGEFAAFEQLLDPHIVLRNGIYWRRVRPFFYRPLLLFHEFAPGAVKPPSLARLGGFQHAVPTGEKANSCLNLLIFENVEAYSLEQLDYNRKRQVKQAAKQFVIRPVADVREFKEQAYPVYLSFYERTHYQHGAQRRNRAFFSQWAEALFQLPKALVLGGYRKGMLEGVSVSLFVEETLCYAMFFCNSESLRAGLSDLMLHTVREAAAQSRRVKRIFSGMYKGGNGLDDFYLLRGCQVVRKPALLNVNPLAAFLLKSFLSRYYAHMRGEIQKQDVGGSVQGKAFLAMSESFSSSSALPEPSKENISRSRHSFAFERQ